MRIRKSTGELVEFDIEKIRAAVRRSGAKPDLIDSTAAAVKRRVRDGMTTRHIDRIVRKELRKSSICISCRYTLREALLRLGPAGFTFETYVAEVLRAYGYTATLPEHDVPGLCVEHEVDVIAEKDGKRVMIEAKFRHAGTEVVDLKDTMATWARYIDLKEGAAAGKGMRFDETWIVTNGRFSDRAQKFADCRGVKTVGWKSKTGSLAELVDHAALYPVTVLDSVAQWELDRLAKYDLVLCRDVAKQDPATLSRRTGMQFNRVRRLVVECEMVVRG